MQLIYFYGSFMQDQLKEQYESSARLISVAGRLLAVSLQKEMRRKSINISTEEWRILFYLWIKEGITQKKTGRTFIKG